MSILMSAVPHLRLDVSELLRAPGATRDLQFHGNVEGLAVPLARIENDGELEMDLVVESLVDGIHVAGRMTGDVEMQCRRCLRPVHERTTVEMDELFLPRGEATEEDQAYEIVDERIDLEPAIRDAVVLALPLNPVCRPECKGLCPTCGGDLNEKDCGHDDERTDLRWGALEGLRKTMEE